MLTGFVELLDLVWLFDTQELLDTSVDGPLTFARGLGKIETNPPF